MTGTPAPSQRFALDTPRAESWLRGEATANAEDPGIDDEWDPRSFEQEGTVYLLVRYAVDAGIISRPSGADLDFDHVRASDGVSYRFLVDAEDGLLELVSPIGKMRHIGEPGITGIPAALAVLEEAVWSANDVLDSLDEAAARRGPVQATAGTPPADSRPVPGTRLSPGAAQARSPAVGPRAEPAAPAAGTSAPRRTQGLRGRLK